jgi:cell division protein FtsB
MNFYQHKIKELAAVIHKQTATKDSLTEELKTLSKESEEKKNHVAYLASKVHENFKTKGENHK